MNLNFVPSLQHFTLAKIAISLCNNHEIKALLEESRISNSHKSLERSLPILESYYSKFGRSRHPLRVTDECPEPRPYVHDDLLKRIDSRMRSMISGLNTGRSNERKIMSFIPHIVLEIVRWEEEHSEFLLDGYDAKAYFCWKSVGTIDRESTAENLLKHVNLSIRNRYHLSGLYCLQNPFSPLWDSIYASHKASLISTHTNGNLLDFWTRGIDCLPHKRFIFPDAMYIINISALQYFYDACQDELEKRAFLIFVLSNNWKNLDLVQFCVSELCQKGYEKLSSLQCYNILRCFLNWPLQNLFLNLSEYLLVKLDHVGMNDLLHDILRFINTHRYEDFVYMNLLTEFWKLIPSCHKDSLKNFYDFPLIKTALECIAAKSLIPKLYHH